MQSPVLSLGATWRFRVSDFEGLEYRVEDSDFKGSGFRTLEGLGDGG